MDDIKVIRVKSRDELPKNFGDAYEAVSDPKRKIVYITKDATVGTLEHEKYHIIKKHPNQPRSSLSYLTQELEAELYAYNKTGYPRQIKGRLIGFANDIMWRRFKNSPNETIKIFDMVINGMNLPVRWVKDWDSVKLKMLKL